MIERKSRNVVDTLPVRERVTASNIQLHIYYAMHKTPLDVWGSRYALQEADIVVPEFDGWDEEVRSAYQEVADGTLDPTKALQRMEVDISNKHFMAFSQQLTFLYGSKKVIVFTDAPHNHQYIGEAMTPQVLYNSQSHLSLHELMMTVKEDYLRREVAEIQTQRNHVMISNLLPALTKAVEENPHLQEVIALRQLKVVMPLGPVHVLGDAFRQEGFSVREEFSHPDFEYRYAIEGVLHLMNRIDIPKSLMLKILMEDELTRIYSKAFYTLTYDSELIVKAIKRLIDACSDEDIIDYIENPGKDLKNFLVSRNIDIPASNVQLRRLAER